MPANERSDPGVVGDPSTPEPRPKPGDVVIVRKGATIGSTHPTKRTTTAAVTRRVRVDHLRFRDPVVISWPGSGGYWRWTADWEWPADETQGASRG